ncbi:MAG TPA: ATP-binding protein [Chitinophagales bacterium]|nr:ATP-binding protein [Chitinophagales bacterium]
MRYTPKYIENFEKLKSYISMGEHEEQDFKLYISSKYKIAKTIIAFANTSGGRILIGVDDRGNLNKIDIEEEMYMADTASKEYCHPSIQIEFIVHQEDDIEILEVVVPKSDDMIHYVIDDNGIKKVYKRVKDQVVHIQ